MSVPAASVRTMTRAPAIEAEQAEHGSLGDGEGHPVDRHRVAEVLDQFDGLDRRGRRHADRRGVGMGRLSGVMRAACRCPLTGPQGNFALGVETRPAAKPPVRQGPARLRTSVPSGR